MVPVEITGTVSNEGRDSNADPNRIISIKTTTYDLSAGGLSLRHATGIPETCLVEAKLSLPDQGRPIKVPCRIIYSEKLSDKNPLYHMGICFLAISESDRARIFRHLFSIQLKMHHF
jgi:c-di-GMP-binding flagellar brake protein YcgR